MIFKSQDLHKITLEYLNSIDKNNPPSRDEIAEQLVEKIQDAYELTLYPIVRISCMYDSTDTDHDMMSIYQMNEPNKGVYATQGYLFGELAINSSIKIRDLYKESNDPVRRFFTEMEDKFTWDLLPFDFLYDLYKSWTSGGGILGRNTFIANLVAILDNYSDWAVPVRGKDGKYQKIRTSTRMNNPEPLIIQYNLRGWYSKTYKGIDPTKVSCTTPAVAYRGILRASVAGSRNNTHR